MVKFGLIISILILASQLLWGQLINENFDYSSGTLTSVTTNWAESPTGSFDIQVVSGSLSYSNYPSSGIGNKIELDGAGASSRSGVIRSFTAQSTVGSTVYFSFLLNIISTSTMDLNTSGGDYFFNLRYSSLSTATRANIYVRQGSNSTRYSIGLTKTSISSLTWYSTELDVGTTYLVVVAYSFISGTDNDAVKLWINPDLSGTEPSEDIVITAGADATDLGYAQYRQRQYSGDMEVDGLRVATNWSQAPLPVKLSSFSASVIGSTAKLDWATATEVNNYGFEILRQAQDDNEWTKIGFVNGNGNSNSPKNYFYEDINISSGKYCYRLKQIDNDGQFEYSKTIEVYFGASTKFELSQNYPNPFNPATTISYNLPEASNVKLTIFNLLGQEIKTLVNEFKETGVHTVHFNVSELNSGLYIYKLQAGSGVQTRKMTLVK